MKKMILLSFLFFYKEIKAQNIGIGTKSPNATAAVDISDTAKGLLIPRIDSLHRINIINPATGLMVYETNSKAFWYYNGTNWLKIGSGIIVSSIADADKNTYVTTEKNPNENIIRFSLAGNERWLMKNISIEENNGSNSIYLGKGSGQHDDLTAAKYNVAVGDSSLTAVTSGFNNTATGAFSLYNNTSGSFNVADGRKALYSNIDGVDNIGVGNEALATNSSGSINTAVGDWAARFNTSGNFNTGIGGRALYSTTAGSGNTALGLAALYNNDSGNNNIAIGYNSGVTNTKGNNITLIGMSSDVLSPALSNATAIGYNAKVSQSSSLILGGTGTDAVNVGIGTTNPTERLEVAGNIKASGTITPSDIRFKKQINPLKNSLQKILAIKGVSYYWRQDEFPAKGFDSTEQLGFIAQDIEKTFPQVVFTEKDGYKGMDYSRLIPVLAEAIKDEHNENEELKKRIEKIERSIYKPKKRPK